MKLDNRLQSIADYVIYARKVLDVGTDHGYLCLYLVQNMIAESGIASDISSGSLKKAVALIAKEKMEDKIECRLGSGLKVLKDDDMVDTVVIAGMGGVLISELLEEDKDLIAKTKPKLILQPVQRPEALREYLINNLYSIKEETLAAVDGKIYNIIVANYLGIKDENYDTRYFEIGKYTYKKSKIYIEQLEFLISKYELVITSMKKAEQLNQEEIKKRENYISFLKELRQNEIKNN